MGGEIVRREPAAPEKAATLDPEEALKATRTRALVRHARAFDAIVTAQNEGGKWSPEQATKLNRARDAFEEVRPYGWRDAEAAYKKDTDLAHEAGSGRVNRAIRALQLETEIHNNPAILADRFIERWQSLDRTSQRQYQAGDIMESKATRRQMGEMLDGLHRDPQLESLLANRKRELGIAFDSGRRLGDEIAFHAGIDLGRGRGIGI